jgi:Ca-activated chloride channel homolog
MKRFGLALGMLVAGAACGGADSGGGSSGWGDDDGGADSGWGDGDGDNGDGDGDGDGGGGTLPPGAGQGGSQDFGLFRQILLQGGIPGPETIDDVGFFNEHKIALPLPDCGHEVCIHGMLGVMGNMINGANCTVIMAGMNTPVDPEQVERPPLNLGLAIDTSGSMVGQPISATRNGLEQMLEALTPEDRVTLVSFSYEAHTLVENVPGDAPELAAAIQSLQPGGGTNIYDGLRETLELVDAHALPDTQNRVILLSDGIATDGITNDDKIVNLAGAYAETGLSLSTIGLGSSFDVELMRALGEVGGGAFYFVEEPSAVEEIFVEEVEFFLIPLAEQVEISVDVGLGYDLRGIYGTRLYEMQGNHASIEIPTLQIAHRTSSNDSEHGRRGGGGALIFEVIPSGDAPADVGSIDFSYRVPGTQEIVQQQVEINSPLQPWETPEDGYFEGDSVEKSFVMLNIYIAFELAAEHASVGNDPTALAILRALRTAAGAWVAQTPDADIEDDLLYVDLFIQNLEARQNPQQSPEPVPPPNPWPGD